MSEINRMTENDKRLSGAAMDEYALMIARRLAAVDRHRLAGADTQFVAILQCALIEAMREGVKRANEDATIASGSRSHLSLLTSPSFVGEP